jgi:general secretion pathway protein L
VGPDCLAYSSLAEYLPSHENESRAAVVDVGQGLASICILGPKGVEFGRTVVSTADGIHDSASATLMVRELRQTFSTHQTVAAQPVSKVWLCGDGAEEDELVEYFAEQLDVQVERLGPEHLDIQGIEELETSRDDASVHWAKSLGLALHAHQGGRRGWLNLRRGSFAFKGDFAAVRGRALRIGGALLLLALLAIGSALVNYFSLNSTHQALDSRIKKTTMAILKKEHSIEKAIFLIKEKLSPDADPLPRVTALDSLFEIHNRVPAGIKFRLRDINISPKRIRMEGFTKGFESVEKIKTAFEKNKCFKEVRTGRVRNTDDGVEFELTVVNGC